MGRSLTITLVSCDLFRNRNTASIQRVAYVVANLQTCWSLPAYDMGLGITNSVASTAAMLIDSLKAEGVPRMILWE